MDKQPIPESSNTLNTSPSARATATAGPDGSWWTRNGLFLIALAILLVVLITRYGLDTVWSYTLTWGLVLLGLGFVIFIHELGHFLVAKWCDVHVETFSIGFGPAIPGCKFQKGETTYMLAWVPLGGYVKMVGENPDEDEEEDPRSFKNKTVGQRMAIISAGVIMNVIFGFFCFIVVYRFHGVERPPAIAGKIESGSPLWQQGIQSGMIIEQIGQVRQPYFDDLQHVVALSGWEEKVPFAYRWPGEPERRIDIEPRRGADDLKPVIGVVPPYSLQLIPKEFKDYRGKPYNFTSAAARAEPAFDFDDVIVAATDPDQPGAYDPNHVTPLPLDPRDPTGQSRDYFVFRERLRRLAGREIMVDVERQSDKGPAQTVRIKVPPAYHYTLGLRMRMGKIAAVRPSSWGKMPEVQVGDVITQVQVVEPDGQIVRYVADPATFPRDQQPHVRVEPLDPMRLPDQLEQWAEGQRQALAQAAMLDALPTLLGAAALQWPILSNPDVTLTILRHHPPTSPDGGHKGAVQLPPFAVPWDFGWRAGDDVVPLSLLSPLPINGLNLAYRVDTTIEEVQANSPAEKGTKIIQQEEPASLGNLFGLTATSKESPGDETFPLQKGDVIKAVRFNKPRTRPDAPVEPGAWIDLEDVNAKRKRHDLDQWAYLFLNLQQSDSKDVTLRVERGKEQYEVRLTAEEDLSWPTTDRGIDFANELRRQKADGLFEAIGMGLNRTSRFIQMMYVQLQRLIEQRLSWKLLGGPVQIARTAYQHANYDFYAFLFLLGIISINLAVINFLPIPVLDGGHMVFLIWEKLAGKPPSEAVRAWATGAGLVFILGLMLFVFVLDISRLF
ncbi:MAG: site-2 protease family protein [Gemmataceae bacterium]